VSVDFNDARLPRRMKPLGEIYRTICLEGSLPDAVCWPGTGNGAETPARRS
jgi:hypothetical protein